MNIVDKAKTITRMNRKNVSKEDMENFMLLSIAWAKDELSFTQVYKVLGYTRKNNMNIYSKLASGLKEAIRRGVLK